MEPISSASVPTTMTATMFRCPWPARTPAKPKVTSDGIGTQRRIEGPDVSGRRVLAVEDTSTTGASVLTAVDVLRDEGAIVAGVAVLVDRGARDRVTALGLEFRAAYDVGDLCLG